MTGNYIKLRESSHHKWYVYSRMQAGGTIEIGEFVIDIKPINEREFSVTLGMKPQDGSFRNYYNYVPKAKKPKPEVKKKDKELPKVLEKAQDQGVMEL